MPTLPDNSRKNYSLYPLAWLAVCFAVGIIVQNYLQLSLSVCAAFCLAGFALSIVALRRKTSVIIFLSFIFAGALSLQVEKIATPLNRLKTLYDEKAYLSGEPVEITGIVRGRPETSVGGFFLEIKTEKILYQKSEKSVSGIVRVFAPVTTDEIKKDYDNLNLHDGLKLRFACELTREKKFQNPGAVLQKEILDQRHIDAVCNLKSPLLTEAIGEAQTFASLNAIYDYRQSLIDEIRREFSVSTAGVLTASLLGNRYYLDKNTAQNFREGGTFHIVVISGLQITFIGGLVIMFVRRLTKKRWMQFLTTTVFLWTYALAVGADAPVTRAALMFTILYFAHVIYRQRNLFNALGATVLLMLVWQPSDIFSQSFQLTLICVTAIVAAAFPLLEKIRAIGQWQPSAENPVPPGCSPNLRAFCESLYWSERDWISRQKRSWWTARIFKSSLAARLENLRLQKITRYIFETLLVSLIVQAWMIPLLIIYFHRISIVGIFLNVWVGIVIALESMAALAAIFCAQISDVFALPFVKLTEILNYFLLNFSGWFIESDWASFRLPHYSGKGAAFYILYYIPLLFLTYKIHRWNPFGLEKSDRGKTKAKEPAQRLFNFLVLNKTRSVKLAGASLLLLFAIIIFHPFSRPPADGLLHVDFLDVGQGDAALITLPSGELLLVDGGGQPSFNVLKIKRANEAPEIFEPDVAEIGETVVSNFLWQKGYDQVDYLLATHADTDHMQGLSAVARNFDIKGAFFGRTPPEDVDYLELQSILQKRSIPQKILSAGDSLVFGTVKIEILHPPRGISNEDVSSNNNSLVLRLSYGNQRILLTGDIERETENKLIETAALLKADVVKVAHHGSNTSSSQNFINSTKAQYAIISVGKKSPYGHPKEEIIEHWKAAGAKVLTTGENGMISIVTDGKNLELKTFLIPTTLR